MIDVLAQIDTPKLEVPNVFKHGVYSSENRSFIINPLGEGGGERRGRREGGGRDERERRVGREGGKGGGGV